MKTHKRVTPVELKTMIHDGAELALLDVREAGQFGESHLLFATPLPYSRLELDVTALVPRTSARTVLCDDGESTLAVIAAKRLEAIGYSDVAVLEGGTRAWAAAGFALFAGVNVPSKLFGELVEHEYGTPRVTVTELARMKAAGEDFVIVDGRPYSEYHKMNIPGGICCPNAELPYRIQEIVRNPETTIVVNCAGRTRSILGAQILLSFGVANPVFALENGTQGWVLADMELERGAARKYPPRVNETDLPRLRMQAAALMTRHDVKCVSDDEVEAFLADSTRTTYLLDVRTPEEYGEGSIAGAVHAPGGQLIQATDQWVGVRNARLVLIDNEGVRAPVVASWLAQLGCDVYVLREGMESDIVPVVFPGAALPDIASISADALKQAIEGATSSVFDIRPSMRFREIHIEGSRWSTRARIVRDARAIAGEIVLVAEHQAMARLAAIDLKEAGVTNVKVLDGGFHAWLEAGYRVASSPDSPPDEECIDHLFFVHDRHAGNREAMRQYLAWETGLIAQLDAQDRQLFPVGPAAPQRTGTDNA